MKSLLLSLTLFASQAAHAYFVASPLASLDPAKPTHILVSGRGDNLGRQPQLTALGVSAKIQERGEQVVLISVFEDDTNRQALESKGYKMLKVNEGVLFNTSSIMPELVKYAQISSLQFFGHNSPTLGTQTDDLGQRFDFRDSRVAKLAGHFTTDGYVFIHGCNAGWIIAPLISKRLGVPAAGAFTGTHFERLHEDKNFYVADSAEAPNLNWARLNSQSYDQPRDCAKGGCLRMRPTNSAYSGHWGNFANGALPFYKFFCETQAQDKCDRVMALSLRNFLTTTRAQTRNEFIDSAKDFVCPPSRDRVLSNNCHQAMELPLTGDKTAYSSMRSSPAIQCDFKSCAVKFACGETNCTIDRTSTVPSTTQANEFLAYVCGFDGLHKQN